MIRLTTAQLTWDAASKEFCSELSCARVPVSAQQIIVVNPDTGRSRTFSNPKPKYDQENDLQLITWTCGDLKLVLFND